MIKENCKNLRTPSPLYLYLVIAIEIMGFIGVTWTYSVVPGFIYIYHISVHQNYSQLSLYSEVLQVQKLNIESLKSKVKVIPYHPRATLVKVIKGQGYPRSRSSKVLFIQGKSHSMSSQVNYGQGHQRSNHPRLGSSKVDVFQGQTQNYSRLRSSTVKIKQGQGRPGSSSSKGHPTSRSHQRPSKSRSSKIRVVNGHDHPRSRSF